MTTWLNVKNNAESALASAITAAATSLTLITGDGAKFPASNFHISIDDEILLCSSRAGDVLTVTRAQESTAATAHAAGAIVALNVTAGIITQLQEAVDLGAGGVDTFLELTDTPASYAGQSGNVAKVKSTEDGLEFGDNVATYLQSALTPVAGEILRHSGIVASSPFTGTINGAPSATSVTYTATSGEGCLAAISVGADYWGRLILYNLTRGNSRKIVTVDTVTHVITTDSSVDNWASGDSITTQSQTNAFAGYEDIDLSAKIPANAFAIIIQAQYNDTSSTPDGNRTLFIHPFKAYDAGLRCYINTCVANEVSQSVFPMQVISQKITMFPRNVTACHIILTCKGVFTT